MRTKIVVLSLVAATGCVASNGDDAPDAGVDTVALTRAEATAAGQVLAAGIEDAAETYGPISLGATVDVQCVAPTGDTSDADGDTIPANARLTYDCSETRLGYTGTLTGTQSVSDEQPDALAWAFSASTDDLDASLTGPFGGSLVANINGTIVASQRSIAGPFELARTLDVFTVITNVRGIQTSIGETVDWTISYTPTLQWNVGAPAVAGELAADGTWIVDVNGKSLTGTLATPTPLTLTPSCRTRVTAGVARATFAVGGAQAAITVEWSGCDRSSVSYETNLDGT
jgi:hypothetical protein